MVCNSCNLARNIYALDGDLTQTSKALNVELEKLGVVHTA